MNSLYTVYREDGRFWVVAGEVEDPEQVREWFAQKMYGVSATILEQNADQYHSITGPVPYEIRIPETTGRRVSGRLQKYVVQKGNRTVIEKNPNISTELEIIFDGRRNNE